MAEAQEKERIVKGLVLGETLGKGTFGRVVLGTKKKTGHRFALKFLSRDAKNFQESAVKKEIDCMKKIRHKNVVALLASSMKCKYPRKDGTIEDTVLMVLEFANGGDLYDVIYYSGPMKEKLAATYFKQLLEGIAEVHRMGITHRDLKPNNILLDHKFCLKITDFGLSHIGSDKVAPKNKRMKTTWVGTKGYRAPELVLNAKYSNMCDVFALGVCLFVMLLARQPFRTASADDQWYKCIATQNYKQYWKSHDSSSKSQHGFVLSQNAKDMLHQLLCYQPRSRITIANALKHAWMTQDLYTDAQIPDQMREAHKLSYEKKKKDPERQARLAHEGPGEVRSEESKYVGMTVPKLETLMPFWNCYEKAKNVESSVLFTYVQAYCTKTLRVKFKEIEDMEYALAGTYKAVVGEDTHGQTSFVIRMAEFQGKTLFIMYLQKSENSTVGMNNQLDTAIHDALESQQFIGGQFIHELEISDKGLDYSNVEFGDEFDALEEEEIEAK